MRKIKLLKKVSVLSVLVMMLGSIPYNAFAEFETPSDATNFEMDTLDLNIAAATFLNSKFLDEKCISGDTYLDKNIPLFDANGNKIAYYVTFLPKGYAVINNNVNNPAAIEFGEGGNPIIEEILERKSDAHIIYNNPGDIYEPNIQRRSIQNNNQNSLFDYYPELAEIDSELVDQHKKFKQSFLSEQKMLRGSGDYNIVNLEDLPYGGYTSKTIKSINTVNWAIMDDYEDIATNHCGATAVTNLALYFAEIGKSNLKINGSKRDTFIAVHNIVGNGPRPTIANDAVQYFKSRGYTLNYSSANDYELYKIAIRQNKPCGVLLADAYNEWHWILGIGYRNYIDFPGQYMHAIDGWNNATNRYFKMNSGTAWISATEYSMN